MRSIIAGVFIVLLAGSCGGRQRLLLPPGTQEMRADYQGWPVRFAALPGWRLAPNDGTPGLTLRNDAQDATVAVFLDEMKRWPSAMAGALYWRAVLGAWPQPYAIDAFTDVRETGDGGAWFLFSGTHKGAELISKCRIQRSRGVPAWATIVSVGSAEDADAIHAQVDLIAETILVDPQ